MLYYSIVVSRIVKTYADYKYQIHREDNYCCLDRQNIFIIINKILETKIFIIRVLSVSVFIPQNRLL